MTRRFPALRWLSKHLKALVTVLVGIAKCCGALISWLLPLRRTRASDKGKRTARRFVEGIWQGAMKLDDSELRLVIRIAKNEQDQLIATMDSPYQEVRGISADLVKLTGDKVQVEIGLVKGIFEGTLSDDGQSIKGSWRQLGTTLALDLVRVDKEPALNRSQEPKRPYPYAEEEVEYENSAANIKLAATLTFPESQRRLPAVLLISGSGPQDRNEAMLGHKPFLVLADFLTRRGIVVMRVDDRGVGGSTGDSWAATTQDLTDDVLVGVDYLKTRKEINPKQIGLIGHSEGAAIAASAASRSDDIAFIVMLAGPVAIGNEIIDRQVELITAGMGQNPSEVSESREANRKIYQILKEEPDRATAEEKVRDILSELEDTSSNLSDETVKALTDAYMKVLFSPWFRSFLTYNPQLALGRVVCPVLAINGEKDLQVDPKQNLPLIEAALRETGNKDSTIKELPGLNHLFQHCQTGLPAEYAKIDETFAPEALELIASWISGRTKSAMLPLEKP